jgi:hypothetical protein
MSQPPALIKIRARTPTAPRDAAALEIEARICRQIWVNVLLQAARDLLTDAKHHANGVGGTTGLQKHQTTSWIGSRDFREVCQLAGYDPTRVERAFRRRLTEKGAAANLFPHQGAAAHKARAQTFTQEMGA